MNPYVVENTTDLYDDDNLFVPTVQVQFWTYLIFEIPSLFCTVYVLYYLLSDQHLRRQLHNHILIVLLIVCLVILVIDNSLYLDGWKVGHGNSFPFSPYVCLLWWFVDYGFYGAICVFLVWGSLERHILIFYRQYLRTNRQIFYFHYLPFIIISMYIISFYSFAILFPPCENIFYANYLACGASPCYQNIRWINIWDYLLNGVLCNILEAFFSVTLLVRILWKRFYSTQPFYWKQYRKISLQILSMSILSLLVNLPQSLIILLRDMQSYGSTFGENVEPYFFYLTGYVTIILPYICLGCLKELWPKLRFFRQRRRQNRIAPIPVIASILPIGFLEQNQI